MNPPDSTIGVYLRRPSGYAEHFVYRQARAVGADRIISLRPPAGGLVSDVQLSSDAFHSRQLRKLTFAARRKGLLIGNGPVVTSRLRRASEDLDVLYSMFLHLATDLHPLVRGREPMPLVVHAAGSDVTTIGAASRSDARARLSIARRASEILCGSRFVFDRLRAIAGDGVSARLHYIGVPVASEVDVRRDDPFTVVVVSRLHPVKGVDRSIASFAAAKPYMDDARLIILGDGNERAELERQVVQEGLAESVRFLGQVPPTEVDRWLSRAHVLLQHNVRLADGAEEAIGGALLEAAARGVPAVAASSGGVGEAIESDKTGVVVDSGDIHAMASALRSLYESPTLREDLGSEAHAFVRRVHNAEVQDGLLREILLSAARG